MSNNGINNNDWSAKLGERLRDTEVQPSDRLWARIEQSVAMPVVAPRKSIAQWWVAAAVLLVAGTVIFELTEDKPQAKVEHIIALEQSAEVVPTRSETTSINTNKIAEYQAYTPQTATPLPAITAAKEIEQEPTKAEPKQQKKRAVSAPHKEETTKPTESKNRSYTPIEQSPIKTNSRLIALNLSGGVNGASVSPVTPTQPSMLASELLSSNGYMEREQSTFYDTGELSHHAPLTFELSAAYSLTDRLALVAGINYTSLTTDISAASKVLATQRLQFIGIPIALHYDILSGKRFSIYTGVGGSIERLISAKVAGVNIEENKWHTSLSLSLGAHYKLTKWLGIYAEPEVEHYLTETKLTTIRSQAPYNINMKFGVRFSL